MHLKKVFASALTVMTVAGAVPAYNFNVFAASDQTAAKDKQESQDQKETEAVTGWQKNGTYLKDGEKQYGAIKVKGKNYYLNKETGVKETNTWVNDSYYDGHGVRLEKGKHTIDGSTYYFQNGVKVTSKEVKGHYYDADGKLANGLLYHNGKYVYYTNGAAYKQSGWKNINGKIYYFTKGAAVTGFRSIRNKRFYFNKQAVLLTGIQTIGNKTYYFNKKGKIGEKGAAYKNGWKRSYQNIYYFRNGTAVTGLQTIKGHKYYFNKQAVMLTGIQTIGNKTYYFNKKGKTGAKGAALTNGWKKSYQNIYYFRNSTAVKGLQTIRGHKFYFNRQGLLLTGLRKVGRNKYYFGKFGRTGVKGAAKTGLFKTDSGRYFANRNGVLYVNRTIKVNKMIYQMNSNGQVVSSHRAVVYKGMDAKAQKYSSPTKYLILVNRSAHKVGIYTGSKDNWRPKKSFICSNGKPSTPTAKGVFHTGTTPGRFAKAIYFDSGSARCWYATRITRGYLFHSVLYRQSSSPSSVLDGRLGQSVSHGCVRLKLQNAKWIYNNIPRTTTVVIY